ncbi:MAG: hypothetical protein ISP83_06035 [Candidatus Poseidonia sp.]|nr:hypothetical protein [Poseidonia sp.]MBL6747866.1 hypothetical protein [Poseidonia sp.]MBL6807029.1 hypothetical protein [Poseidonia sp.]MBL6892970.1 hypothetical protein [Poseidonia sp.]
MVEIPQHELTNLASMDGYEQMLEIDRLCRIYQTDEPTIRALITSSGTQTSATPGGSTDPSSWDTAYKDVPDVSASSSRATLVDKQQFRFEYDPSRDAAERREQVAQAILCSACGVALGIPDIRPIKVTCPSCMFEVTYTD